MVNFLLILAVVAPACLMLICLRRFRLLWLRLSCAFMLCWMCLVLIASGVAHPDPFAEVEALGEAATDADWSEAVEDSPISNAAWGLFALFAAGIYSLVLMVIASKLGKSGSEQAICQSI